MMKPINVIRLIYLYFLSALSLYLLLFFVFLIKQRATFFPVKPFLVSKFVKIPFDCVQLIPRLSYPHSNQLFTYQYHSGYQEQMSRWPEQPNDVIINWIKDHGPSLIIADFGCGDARLAKSVENKVFSIDLVSNDPSVIACDMSNTPLDSSSVDVAVFCLSLMGTNFPSYLQEANRVLKPHGWLLIAEVKSRLNPNTGGADPNKFMKAICELGFTSISKDFSNKMFILFYFKKKEKQKPKEIEWPELKPCLYKRR